MSDNSTYTNKVYVPKTGQTTSYADYDDGYYQKGSPISPRFVDNGDGTVSDRATGLMWVKNPKLIIPGQSVRADNQIQVQKGNWANATPYVVADLAYDIVGLTYWVCVFDHTSAGAGTFADDRTANPTYWRQTVWGYIGKGIVLDVALTWSNAISYSNGLDYAGYADWRLPNITEMLSAHNLESGDFCTPLSTRPGGYEHWSSTTACFITTSVKILMTNQDIYRGNISTLEKGSTAYARPVRGGN